MKEIEKIFNNFDKLYDNWEDFEETLKCREVLWDYMKSHNFFGKAEISQTELKLDEHIGTLETQMERQGFVYGFRYAVSLLIDCNNIKIS